MYIDHSSWRTLDFWASERDEVSMFVGVCFVFMTELFLCAGLPLTPYL